MGGRGFARPSRGRGTVFGRFWNRSGTVLRTCRASKTPFGRRGDASRENFCFFGEFEFETMKSNRLQHFFTRFPHPNGSFEKIPVIILKESSSPSPPASLASLLFRASGSPGIFSLFYFKGGGGGRGVYFPLSLSLRLPLSL